MRTRPVPDGAAAAGAAAGAGAAARSAALARGAETRDKYYGYKHSLRQYAAILYRTYPPGFAIFLRDEPVEPRNIVN